MCGIVGEINFKGQSVEPDTIVRMRDTLAHRGPDDVGIFTAGQVGFGFRRLAILDLSPAGHQPMTSPDGRITTVLNGEIYNYRELRKSLEGKGYSFHSQSDTEVLLAMYAEYGTDFVQHLRGMFAIAVWDDPRQRLVLVRDRLGKKPLKYYQDADGLIFASELKAMLQHPRVPKQVDPVAIHHYLTLQYVPAPRTGFMGIRKLPPAHYAVIERGQMTIHRYWQLNFTATVGRAETEWVSHIQAELETSVRLRMISDVPLGAFLSGGIDSSAVVAMMAKHSDRPVKTFSIGFAEAGHNELPYARMIADRYATDHTEFIVEPQTVDVLPKLAWQYEEPFADSSALPTYLLAELTRQHVTVALNGDGGDENFAGYERYPIYSFASSLARMPKLLKRLAGGAANSVRSIYPTTLTDRASRFANSLLTPPARQYLEYMQYFSDEYKQTHYTKNFRQQLGHLEPTWQLTEAAMQAVGSPDPLAQAMGADILTYLPDDLLVKVDIATMAWSLEGRSPLLDHVFMEMTATIPTNLKVKGRQKKYIFRRALRGLVPDVILDRPKMGFGVPIEHWFRGELKGFIADHLERFAKRDIFNPAVVRDLLHRHTNGRISYAYQLWSLLMLELWYEQYID